MIIFPIIISFFYIKLGDKHSFVQLKFDNFRCLRYSDLLKCIFLPIKMYNKMKNNHKHKGWNQNEDKAITQLVQKHGVKSWARVARQMNYHYGLKGKSGKQCRQRWYNHLNPGISKDQWSAQEQQIMFQAHKTHGNKWKFIAEKLPGRTDNSIKNHFYSTIRRSLRRIGKLTGSKNSTFQMRKIKPITLSRIFCIAEGRQAEEDQSLRLQNPQFSNTEKKEELIKELKQNCQQIANILRLFSQQKPKSLQNTPSENEIALYKKVIQNMTEINNLYEGQKNSLVRIRKQKQLEKNFDKAQISSQSQIQEEVNHEEDLVSSSFISKEPKITSSGRKSKMKLPTFNPVQNENYFTKNQAKKQQNIEQQGFITFTNSPNNSYSKIQRENYEAKNQEGQQYEFNIQFQDVGDMNLFGFQASPGFLHTPMALTPTGFDVCPKENPQNIQPIKNEECNNFLDKLKEQINKSKNKEQRLQNMQMNLYPSPSSAFKPYL